MSTDEVTTRDVVDDELHRKLDVIIEQTTPREEPPHDLLEVIATVLLGVAAVLTAWSVYQSSLWGGVQDTAMTNSVNETTASADLFQQADTTRSLDRTLFIELLTSRVCDEEAEGFDEFACEQINQNLSPEGFAAVEQWLDNDEFLPFGEEYEEVLYAAGNERSAQAEVFLAEADDANSTGDRYELATTLLTIVLFFAGVSIVVRWRSVRIALLVAASLFLLGAGVYLISLPLAPS